MTRIAMISEHASPLASIGTRDSGGQNVHVAALAAALAKRGHQVRVFTRRDNAALPAKVRTSSGYVVHHIDAGPANFLPKDQLAPLMPEFAERMIHSLRRSPCDLIHAHYWMSGIAGLDVRSHSGAPLIMSFHALGTVKQRHQGSADGNQSERMHWEALLATEADAIAATCSDEVFELCRMGANRSRVHVVPCGVDATVFKPTTNARADTGRHRLLIVSRLVQRKGIDDAIRAMAKLPDTELVIAGGPDAAELDRDAEAMRLRKLSDSLGVSDRVQFLGSVEHHDLPLLFASSDVVLATPWYEPFGIVPLEAMACGKPVVATAVGGLQESIIDGRCGLLVPPRDPDAIASAVQRLLADRQARESFGRAGLRRARSLYSWERIAQLTEQVYGHSMPAPMSVDSAASLA